MMTPGTDATKIIGVSTESFGSLDLFPLEQMGRHRVPMGVTRPAMKIGSSAFIKNHQVGCYYLTLVFGHKQPTERVWENLKKFPVILLIAGVDGSGKGETANLLNEWMDPRHIKTHAFAAPTPEEAARPPMWRFWQALPPKGEIGIFFGSWYTDPIVRRCYGQIKKDALDHALEEIVRFERMLTDEGARHG